MNHGNDSAFPVVIPHGGGTEVCGLTRREYFAGLAMQGLLSNLDWLRQVEEATSAKKLDRNVVPKIATKWAVMAADCLLAQLERKSDE